MPTYNSRVCNLNSGSYNRVYNSLNLLILASLLGLFLLHVLLQCLHKLLHVLLQCLVNILQPSLHPPERDYLYTTAGFTGGDLTAVHHTNFFLTCCRFLVQPAVLSWGNTRILFLLLGLHISGRGLLLGLVITLARPKGPSPRLPITPYETAAETSSYS